jgi:hypothetical protein
VGSAWRHILQVRHKCMAIGERHRTNDVSLDAGFFYKIKNMRFNLIYQHGLNQANSSSQMIQSKNRTLTFSVSTPLWNM